MRPSLANRQAKQKAADKERMLDKIRRELKDSHQLGYDLDHPWVSDLIDRYMDRDTDLYDSDDINEIIDEIFES